MQQGIAKGDVLQRIAGLSFIVGAVLLIVFTILFPSADDPSDTQQVLTKMADNETFLLISLLGIAVGLWGLMIGVVGVYRSISTGGAAAWARLGFYGVIVGTTVITAGIAVSMAVARAAADWVAAGSGVGTSEYSIAASLSAAGDSMFLMFTIVYWLALTFLGIGMARSTVFPKWLGWTLIVLGVATVIVGVPPLIGGGLSQTTELLLGGLAVLSSVWALVIGIYITRKAW